MYLLGVRGLTPAQNGQLNKIKDSSSCRIGMSNNYFTGKSVGQGILKI